MKRVLLLFAFVAISCLGSGAAAAENSAAPAPATLATSAPSTPAPSTLAMDPYLGGELQSRVPMARKCRDEGQCEFKPNGDPCDTPVGCVCGWGGGQRACGRW